MQVLLDLIEHFIIWLLNRPEPGATPRTHSIRGLGVDLDTGDPVTLSRKDLARHLYLLGSTGCGKTTLILQLLEQDIKRNHSVVVLDLRGDLVIGALGVCQRLGLARERVTLLDLRDKKPGLSFNPLRGPGEPFIRALHVLDVVAAESASWGVALEETLRFALLLLAYAEQSITRIEAVFFDRSFRHRCLAAAEDPELVHFWERFDTMNGERQQAIALPVLNKVTPLLAVPKLRQVLSSDSALDLTQLLNTKGHVFLVSLAVDELHRSSRMVGSLLISAIAREMMARVDLSESERNPVRLYVDEFENMASEAFEGIIAEGRRFGLALVLSHQTLSQLPGRLRSVIRNNAGSQILFQCGFEDATTIGRELPGEISADDVRALTTGEAYVMERDGSARHVRFHAPISRSSKKGFDHFRAEDHSGIGVSREEAVEEQQPEPSDESTLEDDWL